MERFLQKGVFFQHPEPKKLSPAIFPVFIPFSGCAQRCLFCSQEVQTGRRQTPVAQALDAAEQGLLQRRAAGKTPPEAAFFGGTFTALPEEDFALCLERAAAWVRRGLAVSLRCSTRPDALDAAVLAGLRGAGFGTVELGVQSFADGPLAKCVRGYDGAAARRGCVLVRESGLRLGIQLLPGMPGQSAAEAEEDVAVAAAFAPDCVRLYPCLVLRGTGLEALWRHGSYAPWELEPAVHFLARACLRFWNQGIPVIRMGLAEEPGLREAVLAGPRHPSLGNRSRSRALYLHISGQVEALRGDREGTPEALCLCVPWRYQGELWGWRSELKPAYAALGVASENVSFWEEGRFALALKDGSPSRRLLQKAAL